MTTTNVLKIVLSSIFRGIAETLAWIFSNSVPNLHSSANQLEVYTEPHDVSKRSSTSANSPPTSRRTRKYQKRRIMDFQS